MRFRQHIVLAAPPAKVFPYVQDAKLLPQWVQGLQRIELTKQARRVAGAEARHHYKESDGHTMQVQEQVLLAEAPRLFSSILWHQNMRSTLTYRLLDLGEGRCELHVETRLRLRPLFFQILAPFMAIPMRRQQRADLERLAALFDKK